MTQPIDLLSQTLLTPELDLSDKTRMSGTTLGEIRQAALTIRVKKMVKEDRVELMKALDAICSSPSQPNYLVNRGIEVLLIADDEDAPINPEYNYSVSLYADKFRAHSNGNIMAKIAEARAALLDAGLKGSDFVDPLAILEPLQKASEVFSLKMPDLTKRAEVFQKHLAKVREASNPVHAELAVKVFNKERACFPIYSEFEKLLNPEIKNLERIVEVLREVQNNLRGYADFNGIVKELKEVIMFLISISEGYNLSNVLYGTLQNWIKPYTHPDLKAPLFDHLLESPEFKRLYSYSKISSDVLKIEEERFKIVQDGVLCESRILNAFKDDRSKEIALLEKKIGFKPIHPCVAGPVRPSTKPGSAAQESEKKA